MQVARLSKTPVLRRMRQPSIAPLPFGPALQHRQPLGPRLENGAARMTTDWGANPAYRLQQQSVPLVPRFVELPFSTRGSTESPGHRTPANSLFVLRTQRRVRRRFSSPPFRVPTPKRSNRGAQSKFGTYSAEIPRSIRPACRSKTMISDQEFGLS